MNNPTHWALKRRREKRKMNATRSLFGDRNKIQICMFVTNLLSLENTPTPLAWSKKTKVITNKMATPKLKHSTTTSKQVSSSTLSFFHIHLVLNVIALFPLLDLLTFCTFLNTTSKYLNPSMFFNNSNPFLSTISPLGFLGGCGWWIFFPTK